MTFHPDAMRVTVYLPMNHLPPVVVTWTADPRRGKGETAS